MEIIFEIFFEVYLELMMLILPVEKATSLKYRILSVLIALIILIGCVVLFCWGIFTVDSGNKMGWIAIFVSVIISVSQIAAGLILYIRKN